MEHVRRLALRSVAAAIFLLWAQAAPCQSASPIDLGGLSGYSSSEPLSINDNGQVVGWSWNPGAGAHAFLSDPGLGPRDLGTLPGYGNSMAWGINDRGWVVG